MSLRRISCFVLWLAFLLGPVVVRPAAAQTRWTFTIINASAGGQTLCTNGSFQFDLAGQTGTGTGSACGYNFDVSVSTTTVSFQLKTPIPNIANCVWANVANNPVRGSATIFNDAVGPSSITGSITTTNVGNFNCRTTLPVTGSWRAQRTILTAAPVITQHPSSQIVAAANTGTFACDASGGPAPAFKWQKLSIFGTGWFDLPSDATYGGVTTKTLSVVVPAAATIAHTTLTVASGDQFRCVATNSQGSATSNAATLTIPIKPQFVKDPAPQTVVESESAIFIVSATGTPDPKYQWQQLAPGATTWVDVADSSTIAGSKTASLAIFVTTLSMNGYRFRATATNEAGSVQSGTATLTVNAAVKPAFTDHPISITVFAGDPAPFSATASGSPAPKYQWQRMAAGTTTWVNLGNGGSYAGTTSNTLTVFGTTLAMSGDQFRANATNVAGTVPSNAAVLTVRQSQKPTITKHPEDRTVTAPGGAVFSVDATGAPEPTFKWQLLTPAGAGWQDLADGSQLLPGTPDLLWSASGTRTKALSVTLTGATMNGYQFRAIATNAAGSTESGIAQLTVHYKPRFTAQPGNKLVSAFGGVEPAAFAAAATANPEPEYRWQRMAARTKVWADLDESTVYAGVKTARLVIANPTASMNGDRFRVLAKNSVDETVSDVAALLVFSLSVVDPACQGGGVFRECAAPYLRKVNETSVALVDDPNKLMSADVGRTGAAADGVTRLLLKVPTASNYPVKFALLDSSGNLAGKEWGTLTDRFGNPINATQPITPDTTEIGAVAFAVYRAPADLPLTAGRADFTIRATSDTNVTTTTLTLVQPPVVFIHGLWSGPSAWQSMSSYLRGRGYTICDDCFVDYSRLSGGAPTFKPAGSGDTVVDRLFNTRVKALNWARNQGYAATQVDVVAHSLGGLVARVRAVQPVYKNVTNYQQGEFHKLITIATPHLGTPFADWLVANQCRTRLVVEAEWIGPVLVPKVSLQTLEEYFASSLLFGPIGPALYAMQTSSPEITRLGAGDVRGHAIVGRAPEFGFVEDWIINPLFGRFGAPATTIHSLLDEPGLSSLHDTFVPDRSQRDGLPATGGPVTAVPGIHLGRFGTALEISQTFAEVQRLLFAPVQSNDFAAFPAPSTQNRLPDSMVSPFTPPGKPCTSALRQRPTDATTAATIELSPAPGTVVRPGAMLAVKFGVSNGQPIDQGLLTIADQQFAFVGDGVSVSTFVGSNQAGRIDIRAETTGSGTEDYRASTYVLVVPEAPLAALVASPGALTLSGASDTAQLRVTATYGDGTSGDLSSAELGTKYAVSSGAGVATVTADGLVQAVSTGTASITVSNGAVATTVDVTVDVSNHPPSLTAAETISVDAGTTRNVALTASDTDGDTPALVGVDLPSFATVIDNGDGTGTLRLQPAAADAGTVAIGVAAVDGAAPDLATIRTVTVKVVATLAAAPVALRFGAVKGIGAATLTAVTTPQQVNVSGVDWTAVADQPWIQISGGTGAQGGTFSIAIVNPSDVIGSSATLSGTIRITSTATSTLSATVAVTLTITRPGTSAAPFGAFDTPADNTTGVVGSIAVTGWALDDVAVTRVRVLRAPVAGEAPGVLVYLGDAVLVDGARPDLPAQFPAAPLNTRGGWGYLLLTNMLPNRGNGVFTLYAYADDAEGQTTALGARTITCDNASATTPFGAIDTPGQGETVSGSVNNFGWVLSPGTRRADPPGGGTVTVFIDGLPAGAPAGWVARADLTQLFPVDQFSGVDRALAVRTFDSTALANGVHTIAWIVVDNAGGAAGIGSRYFTVFNGAGQWTGSAPGPAPRVIQAVDETGAWARVGFGPDAARVPLEPDADGRFTIEAREMERIEVALPLATEGRLLTSGGPLPLPAGSHLDPSTGRFLWQPGPGFVGTYDFAFEDARGSRGVRIVLKPARFDAAPVNAWVSRRTGRS